MDYREDILPVIKKCIEESYDSFENDRELYAPYDEEVEHVSRDGFIPFTDGGWECRGFSRVDDSYSFPKKIADIIENTIEYAFQYSKEELIRKHPELKSIEDDKINYHDLYEMGKGDLAEEMSEMENDYLSDEDIMFSVGAFYYAPDNSHSDLKNKHCVYVWGVFNAEAPYFRRYDKWEECLSFSFSFNSVKELERKLNKKLEKINKFMQTGKK